MKEIGQIFELKGRRRNLLSLLRRNGYFIYRTYDCVDTLNMGEPGNSKYAGRIDRIHGEILSNDNGLSKILREYQPK
jgi:hypothetical protein